MKKIAIISFLILIISVTTFTVAEDSEIEFDNTLDSIIPDASIWGISADTLKEMNEDDYRQCQVDLVQTWFCTDVDVSSYNMDAYYVFGKGEKASNGTTYAGLSKIVYILNDSNIQSKSELDECFQTIVEQMKQIQGEPETEKKNDCKWKNEKLKTEIGKGKMSKYTGSEKTTIAIIFSEVSEVKPVRTARPTKTPRPTSTPKPEYSKIDYKGVSRHPEKYRGKYVKFTGIVVQAQEVYGVEYEGGSLFDEYYVLRVASKYEKFRTIDGYNTDDIVYVVVPKSKVEGGRILEDDKVSVFGRYDGIETYEALLGNSVSIPRVEANRVVIK